jgi:glycosyltransferase involved in cell wall biosynthesis
MRICYVAPDVAVPHYRGSSTHVYEVARNLSKLGHEVHVVARRVDATQAKSESLDGMTVHRFQRGIVFSSRRSSFVNSEAKGSYRGSTPSIVWKSYETYLKTIFPLYIALEVTRLVRESSIDIIFERETAFGAGAMGSMLTGRPLILEVIGNRVSNLQARRSSKIIAYSRGMFEGTPEAGKVETVTGAVDTDMFSPNPAARAEIRKLYSLDSPVIGYVGTFQEWHGLAELTRAAAGLLEKHPNVKFLMVGPYYKETQSRVEAAGLGRSFVFTGPIDYVDVPKYINAADVLVAPYNPDKIESAEQVRKHGLGAPLKVYEYMAVGKPVITTDVRPISDPVDDGVTGYLVPPGDSEALGSALERILDDPGSVAEMGAAARQSMIANYSWGLLARQLSDIFEGVLTGSVAQN